MLSAIKLTALLGLLLNISSASALESAEYKTVEKEGFIFRFRGCKIIPSADVPLKCEFTVENRKEGRRTFNLYANQSRVIDSEGNEITGATSDLGNREENLRQSSPYNFNFGYGSYGLSQPEIVLVNQIPVKASVTFANTPDGEIRLIDLRCYSRGANSPNSANSFNVEFIF